MNEKITELVQKVEQWAEDRNLIEGSTPQKQVLKLMEEFGELCGGIAKNKPDVIKDSIGDCFVVLIILNKQLGFNRQISFEWEAEIILPESDLKHTLLRLAFLGSNATNERINQLIIELNGYASYYGLTTLECLSYAYDQIKDRKGRMIDGIFVKEEDL
ncbi:MazG-like family protein [Pasteurella multocida]|uniref:MazG-like family protein n=1 Tax=Pasteurella multocida TaxID=747 RepID=UPI001F5384EA|nr:MazG-like family protein [Pasteurella multocida]